MFGAQHVDAPQAGHAGGASVPVSFTTTTSFAASLTTTSAAWTSFPLSYEASSESASTL
jgi:hypothetical protein